MHIRSLSRLSLALAPLLALATQAALAQTPASPSADGTLLSVAAHAEARRVPDIATVSAGVVTEAADADTAMRRNAERMARVIAAVRAAGIAERDVQTAGITLQPQYRYAENQPPAITGYQASNTASVTIRDIARLGAILDALVATGANQIHGPSFDIAEKGPVLDEARREALAQARRRAEMYADVLGMRVRRIVSIDETGGRGQPPMPMVAMARMESDVASTPVAPGENALGVDLDIVFELGR